MRSPLPLIALAAALATPALATAAPSWKNVTKPQLRVTEGAIESAGDPTLRTRSAAMRAVMRDGGRHAPRARLRFRLAGPSETVKPLGSGAVRQQIGLKLRAANPCNLVYVMWHATPTPQIEVSVKRNAGQTTSAQCGNRGYTKVASIRMPAPDAGLHVLEAHTRRTRAGALALSVSADGRVVRRQTLSRALTAGLEGPIGVRTDNGEYLFRLAR